MLDFLKNETLQPSFSSSLFNWTIMVPLNDTYVLLTRMLHRKKHHRCFQLTLHGIKQSFFVPPHYSDFLPLLLSFVVWTAAAVVATEATTKNKKTKKTLSLPKDAKVGRRPPPSNSLWFTLFNSLCVFLPHLPFSSLFLFKYWQSTLFYY